MPDERRIAETPKRRRMQLAKSEIYLGIAASHLITDLGKLYDDGRAPEFEGGICERYGLDLDDIRRIADQIGTELETRAMRAGYEDAWL